MGGEPAGRECFRTMSFALSKQPSEHSSDGGGANRARYRVAYLTILGYTAAIMFAEVTGAYVDPLLGMILQGLLLLIMLSHSVMQAHEFTRRLLPVLALMPLLRILSLSVITSLLPTIFLYPLVAIPFAIAIFLVVRLQKVPWSAIGVRKASWVSQTAIALSGVPLSLVGYWLLQPAPLLNLMVLPSFVIAAILVVFAAGVEEIYFRGLLQHAAQPAFGAYMILYSGLVYATGFTGWRSVLYIGAALLLGLYFGWCARRTGALWGVIVAHGAINIGMLMVWPLVL
jgi:membrane protease YdiL (CAAX protease family)